jgi:class 3 adenylate cyclase/DNA-binding winged helix-turn-helix (wHTH) protein/tetratricopeptide (TPR) repeat protein
MVYRFADCALDTQIYTLDRAGQHTRLAPKVFEVLCYLIDHRGRVVSKQELCDQVWEGLAITDAAMESCLRAVRLTVGDSGQAQRIIQTQRGHGYRFVADVTVETSRSGTEERSSSTSVSLEPLEDPTSTLSPSQPVIPPRPVPPLGVRLCAACQYANNENAVFCAACGIRLRQLCVHCGQDVTFPAVFCTACGQPLAAPLAPSSAPMPVGQAEHKSVTVLCCAVATKTAHGTRIDLDALHSLLLELHALAQDVVGQYGGRLHPVMGERLMAMFGVPVAHEDDARRAVCVALELRRRLSAWQERLGTAPVTPLVWRMGLHTGLVVVGGMRNGNDVGTIATIVGDVVSVAAALEERAAPGTILCSDTTARLVHGTVRLQAWGPLQVPGQPAPVETYTVLNRSFRRSPMEQHRGRVLSPFVGREREMMTLRALLAQVEVGRGQVVGIVGEPGLGKSRLVYEFRHSLGRRRLTYRAGRCLSYGSTTPYLPVLDILRHHCGITDTDGPEDITAKIHRRLQEVDMAPGIWAPVLLHLLGLQQGTDALAVLSPEMRKARILTAVTQMCLNGSQQRPLILEIEDLHWIDPSSDECLAALVERMAGAPILVLVTYRPGYRPIWIDRSYVTQVALQPLTSQDSLRVVQAVLPTVAPRAPLVPKLLAKADGNPFFLEELARTVVEQGTDAPSPTVPDTVQAVLLARIDRLPATAKRLLQTAAVIGKDVALPLLQAVTEISEEAMHRALGHLQAAEFLYETYAPTAPAYAFKHALTQEVACQSLVRRARQQYHAHIAQVLEEQFPEVAEAQPELLAYHYTDAGLSEQAISYWQRAGQRAVERSAHVEAVSHFTQGIELLKQVPVAPERTQQELVLQLAIGAPLLMLKGHTAPEVEHAYARASELAQHLGETPQRFSVLVGLWRFYYTRARLHTARELAEQCFTLAQHLRETTVLQEGYQILGSTFFFMGDQVAAHEHLQQGIALYNPQQSGTLAFSRGTDPGVVCLCRAGWVLWWLGYPDKALARSHEAIALAQRLSHPYSLSFALHYNAILHVWRQEIALAKEQLEASIAFMQKHGFVQFLGQALTKLGWVLIEQGAIEEGMAKIRQGLESLRIHKIDLGRSTDLAMLAQAYGRTGQPKEGLHVLGEALAVAHNNAEGFYEAELYRLKGELLLQSGTEGLEFDASPTHDALCTLDVEEAEACFRQAISLARRQSAKSLELRAVMSLCRLWQHQGKRAAARQILKEIYSWFTEGFHTPDLQEAQVLLEALS